MKTKILIAILTVGVFSISTMKAQEKPMNMEQDTMQMDHSTMDHSKMKMKHDSTEMKMDHSKMEMKHDSTEMKIDHSKMTKTFVCPMHPEVTGDKPGECPKCSMNMVEKKEDMKKKDTPKKDKH